MNSETKHSTRVQSTRSSTKKRGMFKKEKENEDIEMKNITEQQQAPFTPVTPSRRYQSMCEPRTPVRSVLLEAQQTPRRSVRKSIKPAQDYDDIVYKRHLRSTVKTDVGNEESEEVEAKQKWTPAKVGRVSEKRPKRGRKKAAVADVIVKTEVERQDPTTISMSDVEHRDGMTAELETIDEKPVLATDKQAFERKQTVVNAAVKQVDSQTIESTIIPMSDAEYRDGTTAELETIDEKPVLGPEELAFERKQTVVNAVVKQVDSQTVESTIILMSDAEHRDGTTAELKTIDEKQPLPEIVAESTDVAKVHIVAQASLDMPILGTEEPAFERKQTTGNAVVKQVDSQTIESTIISMSDAEHHDSTTAELRSIDEKQPLPEMVAESTDVAKVHIVAEASLDMPVLGIEEPAFEQKQTVENAVEKKVENRAVESTIIPMCNVERGIEKSLELPMIEITVPSEEDEPAAESTESTDSNFGKCLNSNDINISGLVPLPEEDFPKQAEKSEQETKEAGLNDTFDISGEDCILVGSSPEKIKISESQNAHEEEDELMESLQLSDDEVVEVEDSPEKQLLESNSAKPLPIPVMPENSTPVRKPRPKPYRFPTPYRIKPQTKFSEDVETDEETDYCEVSSKIQVTNMNAVQAVLRGIRKRSLSVDVGVQYERPCKAARRNQHVTFHSPANETIDINEIDMQISMSASKIQEAMPNYSATKFITTRRKRSISLDDTSYAKSKRAAELVIPAKQTRSVQKSCIPRTKLPNFAEMHKKHFEKMENLVDYVERKAERAKLLTNSSIKSQKSSAIKPISSTKRQVDHKIPTNVAEKPKAAKKMDLANTVKPPVKTSNETATSDVCHLPNPRMAILPDPRMAIIKPLPPVKRAPTPSKMTAIKTFVTGRVGPTKPTFNLSTTVVKSNDKPIKPIAANNLPKPGEQPSCSVSSSTSSAALASKNDKLANRRQRHMDMFKGRAETARDTTVHSSEYVRGIRSNRRFELQMQYRKNLDR